ncbi:hypothetical protein L3N51_02206 [Metallosphaera sp. J1]|uniref:hypothetical protein n=1 Tax=Metallosphaera javensis (ex Hofmann et al. 2022) TaxID=99938 RepID=UPI001EE0165B|nr:hypothetical protein [Metallosphaera javensis (ex Hofmann et al. 2022)]MCG3109909.1 hypothetical protein [Metallosphaera javensis (ex Hofmann et al. 2022)]
MDPELQVDETSSGGGWEVGEAQGKEVLLVAMRVTPKRKRAVLDFVLAKEDAKN